MDSGITKIQEFVERLNEYIANKLPDNNDLFAFLKITLNKIGIKVSYDKRDNGILYIMSLFKQSNKHSEILDYCNGLIFTVVNDKCEILAVPIRESQPIKTLPENIDEYTIYPILDGCNLTMYHYNDKWYFGTTRSVDIRTMSWRGHSYDQIISEMIKIDYNSLNKKYCYHLRMKNNKLHPYRPKVNFVALQGTYDLENMCQVDADIEGMVSVKANNDPKQRVFGCIIKNNDKSKSDLMWESELRLFIKKCVYSTPYVENEFYRRTVLELYNKKDFYIVYNYMDKVNSARFIKLFPEFNEIFKGIDEIIANAISLFLGDKSITDEKAIKLNSMLLPKIQKRMKTKNKQLLIDFIMDSTNAVVVYDALYDELY